jgi:hypothetical protein
LLYPYFRNKFWREPELLPSFRIEVQR